MEFVEKSSLFETQSDVKTNKLILLYPETLVREAIPSISKVRWIFKYMTHSCRKGQVLANEILHNGSFLTQTIYWIWDSYQWAGKTKYTWWHLNQNEVMGGASTYFAACCSSSSQHPDRNLVFLWDTHSPLAFSLPAFSAVSCEAFNRGFSETVAFRNFSHGRL